MNPDTLKLAGLFVGAACVVGSFFMPTPVAQAAVFGTGTGILGWVGVRRPGDKKAKRAAADEPPATKPDP